MDKQLILAVAGSGKTYYIVEQLNDVDRFLLITFTINGTQSLKDEVIKRFGYFPKNIKISNYFSFLYSFCYKPIHADEMDDKGICWQPPASPFDQSFMTKGKYLYYNRIAKYLLKKSLPSINQRLTKYYDYLFIDEIQDFGGHDFDFLTGLLKSPVKTIMVGDFFQHTFDTSRDKNKNQSLHKDYPSYLKRFQQQNITANHSLLVKSRRCSKTVCDFIRTNLGVDIHAHEDRTSECRLLTDAMEIKNIIEDNTIVKLFYRESNKFRCQADNWGACKGLTYQSVCVVVGDDMLKQLQGTGPFSIASPLTKNKFYVACSRPREHLYFVSQKHLKKYKK